MHGNVCILTESRSLTVFSGRTFRKCGHTFPIWTSSSADPAQKLLPHQHSRSPYTSWKYSAFRGLCSAFLSYIGSVLPSSSTAVSASQSLPAALSVLLSESVPRFFRLWCTVPSFFRLLHPAPAPSFPTNDFIPKASDTDCAWYRRSRIAKDRAEFLSALVHHVTALPTVSAGNAGMVTVRSRTLAHHTFKRAIRKVHRFNSPVLPSEESHAVSVHGIGTSCLCASMPYAAFPLHCHHSDGAGNQGLQYIPCLDALHSPHFSLYKTAISLRRVAQRQSTVGLNSPSIFICCSFLWVKTELPKASYI